MRVNCKWCGIEHEKDKNRGLQCRKCFNARQKMDYHEALYADWKTITPNQVTSMSWKGATQ